MRKTRYKVLTEDNRSTIKGTKSFENTIAGQKAFLLWCEKRNKTSEVPITYVMEATGVYYEELDYFLHNQGLAVSVQLANKLKYFAKSNNLKTKNDKVDSKMIAEFGIEKHLSGLDLWTPPSKEFKIIRDLSREHTNLKNTQGAAKSRLHALEYAHETYPEVIKMKKEQIAFYEAQLMAIEKELRRLVSLDEKFKEKLDKIETIKGLGFITIIKVLAEVNGFLLFKNIAQLISYSGLDIIEDQSGKHKGKTKISKKGNAHIRAALFMPVANPAQRGNVGNTT